mmetsp:Transcript_11425/g.33468  ORF Transcript_11425/g.33468 Transcript_11425/m.33468 type:complete len:251 (+) Transcript_11425:214-966(+)
MLCGHLRCEVETGLLFTFAPLSKPCPGLHGGHEIILQRECFRSPARRGGLQCRLRLCRCGLCLVEGANHGVQPSREMLQFGHVHPGCLLKVVNADLVPHAPRLPADCLVRLGLKLTLKPHGQRSLLPLHGLEPLHRNLVMLHNVIEVPNSVLAARKLSFQSHAFPAGSFCAGCRGLQGLLFADQECLAVCQLSVQRLLLHVPTMPVSGCPHFQLFAVGPCLLQLCFAGFQLPLLLQLLSGHLKAGGPCCL